MSAETINRVVEVLPKILDVLKKEGHLKVTEDNIKIWGCDTMLLRNVATDCQHIRDNTLLNVLVYTNQVPEKKYFLEAFGIHVLDEHDLRDMAIKHDDLDLYDML